LESFDISDYSHEISNIQNNITYFNDNISILDNKMALVLFMLSGLENTHVKDIIIGMEIQIVDVHNEISIVNNNIASVSDI
jgi:hypothetical protein